MTSDPLPFHGLAQQILADLTAGHCVSVTGLSNSGKTTLLRALAGARALEVFRKVRGEPGELVYIDCNRAVEISAQAFYEVVLRSSLEHLSSRGPAKLMESLRRYYEAVTEADSAFAASLSFNLALTELCEQLGKDLCLLIDEFDELYMALDDRTLLNLRALRDRFHDRLRYVTATVRSLPVLRGRIVEGEFAEMFSRSTYAMHLLDPEEAERLVAGLALAGLRKARVQAAIRLAGGHPGLLVAVAQALAALPEGWEGDPIRAASAAPQPRAESMKIWSQLTGDEQAWLATLVGESDAGLPRQQLRHLARLGLLREDGPFSPLFANFVLRRSRGPESGSQGIHLDVDSGDVWVDSVRIPVLTDLEFRLLRLLYERRDKLTDKYRIVTGVWGEEYLGEVDDARVEKLVSRLRSKIEPDPSNPVYLITQRGRGYKLLSQPRPA